MFTVGIDIGGTKISGVLLDAHDKIVTSAKIPTPAQDSDAIATSVVELVRQLSGGHPISAVGVAAAGFINEKRSTVIYSPNLSWRNEPLKQKLEDQLKLPVVIENDANAAGWAEYRFGAGRNVQNQIMITIGTGVGGAIIADGKLYRGGFGIGAELGHYCFMPDGLPCGCGQRGCLEQYASGTALLREAKALAKSNKPQGEFLRSLVSDVDELSGKHVFEAVIQKDPGTLALVNELAGNLGKALASFAAILDPELVVIGGGVSAVGDQLIEPIRASYIKHLPAAGFRPEFEIRIAELVNDAGAVGAADLARELTSQR